ncbi:Frag1/DRAM/Sfk1 family-domain-containing protein [Hyaloscypha finlandica]|nr:Frag1/DRAM/Sfk1 family-domain-containing protein [Hyaloscypha finlandica]
MLLGLLISWNVNGRPRYPSMENDQDVAYISDVGGDKLKPLFIAGSCVTTIFLDLSFLSERWLRHRGRLVANVSTIEKVLSGLSMAFALLGTIGLILLSIFDTRSHHTLHDIFLLFFILGYVVSAIFICWEYQRLGAKYREHRILRASFWIKLAFILIEIALAVAFAACNFRDALNAAGILEWTIAFIFTFYGFSFFIDLLPATQTKRGTKFPTGPQATQMQMEENDQYGQGYAGRNTVDSQRTLGANNVKTTIGVKHENGQAPVASNF